MKNSKFLKLLISVNAVLALENKTEELPDGCRWTEWVNSDHPSKIDEFSSIDGKGLTVRLSQTRDLRPAADWVGKVGNIFGFS